MKHFYTTLLSIILTATLQTSYAQEKTNSIEKPKKEESVNVKKLVQKGIKIKLNESGSSFSTISAAIQFGYRDIQLNPGSKLAATGEDISRHQDIASRRTRFLSFTNIENKFFMFINFGSTNSAYYDNQPQTSLFIHDFWGKFRIAENTFLGGGLHMWSGLSRYTMVGGLTQMSLDFPVNQFPNVNVNNQLNRQYGVFLQGRLSNFDYVFAVNQMMMPKDSKVIKSDEEIINDGKVGIASNRYVNGFTYKGYVSYSFFGKDRLTVPFKLMTYLGKKGKFLNIGAGFNYSADAAGAIANSGDTHVTKYDQFIWSADVFFETPLANKSALTIYGVYYNANYGPKYLRKISVMGGFASGGTSLNGPGITEFNFGTGDMTYFSIAYLLPKSLWLGGNEIMPYYSNQYRNFDGLNEASLQHDFGLNYFIAGNKIKLTAQYSTRPIFSKEDKTIDEYLGMFQLQLQFRI